MVKLRALLSSLPLQVAGVISMLTGLTGVGVARWMTGYFRSMHWNALADPQTLRTTLVAVGIVLFLLGTFGPKIVAIWRQRRMGRQAVELDPYNKDVLDAIVKYARTTPAGRVRLRKALQQQGARVNIGTINIYSDALRGDDRVSVEGPPGDPEIVRIELHDQVQVTDQLIVEKGKAPTSAATLQGETVRVEEAKADAGEEEEEEEEAEEVKLGPWFSSERTQEGWARHRQHGDYIELAVRNLPRRGILQDQFACYVEEPNGDVTWVMPEVNVVGSSMAIYPFEDSPDLVDGDYVVRWRARGFGFMMGDAARDRFTIRGGRLGR